MLPNGNYENVVSPIQHQCRSKDNNWNCIQYGWEIHKLTLILEEGDPYEDGYKAVLDVKFCPFCGYSVESQLN